MAPSHRFNSSFETDEAYIRSRAIDQAERDILAIIQKLEAAHNLRVTEIFPHDTSFTRGEDGVVICWQIND